MKNYYRTLMRQPNFGHPVRVSIVMQTPHRFVPLPGMTSEQIKQGLADSQDTGYADQADDAERRD